MPDGPRTPTPIVAILDSGWFWLATRVVVTFMFWITAIQWMLDFSSATGAAESVGLRPSDLWGVALILLYVVASAMILLDRWLWLGAGALGVFTALTIPLSHPFWAQPPEEAAETWLTVKEHVTVIGGLMAVAVASHWRRRGRRGVGDGVI